MTLVIVDVCPLVIVGLGVVEEEESEPTFDDDEVGVDGLELWDGELAGVDDEDGEFDEDEAEEAEVVDDVDCEVSDDVEDVVVDEVVVVVEEVVVEDEIEDTESLVVLEDDESAELELRKAQSGYQTARDYARR